jgi:hypothetical protein
MYKKTEELDKELSATVSIKSFLIDNADEFEQMSFCHLLNKYVIESGKSKFTIALESCLSEPFIYNLLNAEKRPTRDTVIKLSFGLNLNVKSTEQLLKLAGYRGLYVRHKRDVILKFAIENRLSLLEADEVLNEYGYQIVTE